LPRLSVGSRRLDADMVIAGAWPLTALQALGAMGGAWRVALDRHLYRF